MVVVAVVVVVVAVVVVVCVGVCVCVGVFAGLLSFLYHLISGSNWNCNSHGELDEQMDW